MHHRNDPNPVRLVQKDQRVGEFAGQGALGGREKMEKPSRFAAHFADKTFDFEMETQTQIRGKVVVIFHRPDIFVVRPGMEHMGFHRRRIFRMRAATSAGGTPVTCPDSISATRRRISAVQAASVSGSLECKSSLKRPTNSPTCSGGQWRVSSRICSTVIGMAAVSSSNTIFARGNAPRFAPAFEPVTASDAVSFRP